MQKRIHASCALTLSAIISVAAQAQTGDAEIDPMEVRFRESLNAPKMEGQSCYDFIQKKRWTDGYNQKADGSSFFVAVGTSQVNTSQTSKNYATGMMNAAIRAQLVTKSQLSRAMSEEMTSQIAEELISSYSDGEPPEFAAQPAVPTQATYDELGYYEKFKLLINQQLDKAIDEETKDAFNQQALSAAQAEEEIREILNQSSFTDTVTTKSNATIRGMKGVFTSFDSSTEENKTVVCVVGLWSEKLARQVDAVTTGDYEILKGQKPGKPLLEYVGDESSSEGYKKLLGTYGTFIVRNDKGEVSILSYAQESIMGSRGEQTAFSRAELRAKRGILQLREEHVDLIQVDTRKELTTEYVDGTVDPYTEQYYESKLSATSAGNLKGATPLKRWKLPHLNGEMVAGVIVAWTPSGADLAETAQRTMAEQPNKSPQENTTNVPPIDAEVGSALGDDEDDF